MWASPSNGSRYPRPSVPAQQAETQRWLGPDAYTRATRCSVRLSGSLSGYSLYVKQHEKAHTPVAGDKHRMGPPRGYGLQAPPTPAGGPKANLCISEISRIPGPGLFLYSFCSSYWPIGVFKRMCCGYTDPGICGYTRFQSINGRIEHLWDCSVT